MQKIKDWLNSFFKDMSKKKTIFTIMGIIVVVLLLITLINQAFV